MICTAARAQPSAEQLEQDAEWLAELQHRLHPLTQGNAYRLGTSYSDGRVLDDTIQEKLDNQRAWLALREESLERAREFQQRYGSAGPLDRLFRDYLEYTSVKWSEVQNHILNPDVNEVRRENIGNCFSMLDTAVDTVDDKVMRLRIPILHAIQRSVPLCLEFTENPPPIFERKAAQIPQTLEPIIEETRAAELEMLQGRRWPSGARRVSGGGSARALANAAKRFLSQSPNWGGHPERNITVVAVTVASDWVVAERSITGQPTKYGLPVHAAVIQPETPEGQVDHFELTMVTPTARKGPRFEGARVGDYERMLIQRVPGGRRAARRR